MKQLCPVNQTALRAVVAGLSHRSAQSRQLHRLHAVLLVAEGSSCPVVARWFGDNPRSVARWVHAFEHGGADGLLDSPGGGRPPRLPEAVSERLQADLAGAPDNQGYLHAQWSGKLVALHLDRRYGLQLSERQCQRLLLGHRR